jgi:hypothetical protein
LIFFFFIAFNKYEFLISKYDNTSLEKKLKTK